MLHFDFKIFLPKLLQCCRLFVAQTICTVVPRAPHVMWQQELVTAMHILCRGMNWLGETWLSHLPMMFSVLIISHSVLMEKLAVSCSQATMAAVRILR